MRGVSVGGGGSMLETGGFRLDGRPAGCRGAPQVSKCPCRMGVNGKVAPGDILS